MNFIFEGIELDVDFYYEAAEAQTWSDPGNPEECWVEAVRHKGEDISVLIGEEVAVQMADKYLKEMRNARD
jgi:hypothetical protein